MRGGISLKGAYPTPAFEEIIYSMTTDDFADKVIPFPTVIKIDVDGNELSILKGMQRVLSAENKPRSVQIEINPGYRAQIIALMEGHGYALDHSHYCIFYRRMFY